MAQTEHTPRDAVREHLPSQVSDFLDRIRRSVLLTIAASGVALMVLSAFVLSQFGWDTVAGLLTVSGFNVTLIGIVGYLIYQALERRF